jgi:hypothetical protein
LEGPQADGDYREEVIPAAERVEETGRDTIDMHGGRVGLRG